MGYLKGERNAYWKETKQAKSNIPTEDLTIWTTDNNGEIARPTPSQDEETQNAHIGRWNLATENEKGNGGTHVKILRKFEMASPNAIYPPGNVDPGNLATWISGDGSIRKQLDYVLVGDNINAWINYPKAKGAARKKDIRRNLVCMEIRANLKTPPREETRQPHQF